MIVMISAVALGGLQELAYRQLLSRTFQAADVVQSKEPKLFSVHHAIDLEHELSFVTALSGSDVMVYGNARAQWVLIRYNTLASRVTCEGRLDVHPDGLTEVTLSGRRCVAVSFA